MNFLAKLSFKLKIILLILVISSLGILVTVTLSYFTYKRSLVSLSHDQLHSIASISKKRTEDFLARTKTFTSLLAKDRLSEGLILAYESAFYAAGKTIGKDEVLKSSAFDKLHETYKDKVSEQINSYQIDRFLLVNAQGQVVFSSDFDTDGKLAGRSLTNGAFKNLQIAKCAQDALKSTTFTIYHHDTEYNPIIDDNQNVFCTRIMAEFDHLSEGIKKGDLMGAIIVEFSDTILSKLLSERAGMGVTGQAYVLGVDGLLRSDLYHDREKFNSHHVFKNNIAIKNEIVDLVNNKNQESGEIQILNPSGKEVMASFEAFKFEDQHWIIIAEKETREILAPIYEFIKKIVLICVVLVLIVVFCGIYFSTKITKPITDSIELVKKICQNLKLDSSNMNENADVLANNTESQARDLQSTVQAIDQITTTIEQNTNSAKNSSAVSNSSLELVNRGKKVVNDMITTMKQIDESNNHLVQGVEKTNLKLSEILNLISEIENKTKVINDIVFQTKLLSFNASVESARAGEHGKGFAVVAEEVGKLAELSGDSAKSISELLQQSIERVNAIISETRDEITSASEEALEKVQSGQTVALECGRVFESIIGDVSTVTKLVEDISLASNEQNIGMNEINQAMNRLNSGTSRNTEVATKSLEAAKKLAESSDALTEMILVLSEVIYGTETVKQL